MTRNSDRSQQIPMSRDPHLRGSQTNGHRPTTNVGRPGAPAGPKFHLTWRPICKRYPQPQRKPRHHPRKGPNQLQMRAPQTPSIPQILALTLKGQSFPVWALPAPLQSINLVHPRTKQKPGLGLGHARWKCYRKPTTTIDISATL